MNIEFFVLLDFHAYKLGIILISIAKNQHYAKRLRVDTVLLKYNLNFYDFKYIHPTAMSVIVLHTVTSTYRQYQQSLLTGVINFIKTLPTTLIPLISGLSSHTLPDNPPRRLKRRRWRDLLANVHGHNVQITLWIQVERIIDGRSHPPSRHVINLLFSVIFCIDMYTHCKYLFIINHILPSQLVTYNCD